MLYREGMEEKLIISAIAALTLLPVGLYCWRNDAKRGGIFWLLLLAVVFVFAGWLLYRLQTGWQRGLSDTLYVCVAATSIFFTLTVHRLREGWRVASILFPYLFILCVLALLAPDGQAPQHAPNTPNTTIQIAGLSAISRWTVIHILSNVIAYATITMAAVAACAVLIQERFLKAKNAGPWSKRLPPVADSERIEVFCLATSEAVLLIGIISGMALQLGSSGSLLEFDHKTLLTIVAFAIVGLLLLARAKSGIRGRFVARFVLLSYLLITLGYPGVKWVTDVLLT
jgi:ABC-type uncharacterized transport system permease subunit